MSNFRIKIEFLTPSGWKADSPSEVPVVAIAARESDLNVAVRIVQDYLGVETGDVAGIFFSEESRNNESWRNLKWDMREELLHAYVDLERNLANP